MVKPETDLLRVIFFPLCYFDVLLSLLSELNRQLILFFAPLWVRGTFDIVVAFFVGILLLFSHFGSHTFTCSPSAVSTALVLVLLVVFVLAMLSIEATFIFVVAATLIKLGVKLTYRF